MHRIFDFFAQLDALLAEAGTPNLLCLSISFSRTRPILSGCDGVPISPIIGSEHATVLASLMTEWNIQSRAHACEACGKHFADKETYHTLLFDEKADFRRSDICQACWQKQYSEGARERKGFISYWHGVYHAPPPPNEPIKKENAESLLRKIIELNDPQYIPAAYILAVMLERKRLLKVKEQLVRDGQRVFIYEQPTSGDVITIIDPNLQLNQLETVQRNVGDLLEHGFNPPAQPAPAETAPEAPSQPAAITTTE